MLTHLLYILLPLTFSNLLHMLVVKKNYISGFNVPISNTLFGKNKTWRGLIAMTVLNAAMTFVFFQMTTNEPLNNLVMGAALGLVYVLSELPNSLLKRRIGIGEGESGKGALRFFTVIDKMDSAAGISVFYYLTTAISLQEMALIFLAGSLTHATLSLLFYQLKLKAAY